MKALPRGRLLILALLFLAPMLFLVGYGGYYVWDEGWGLWFGWATATTLSLAYFLAWRWQARQYLLKVETQQSMHWTDRDRLAWQLIEARAKAGEKVTPEQLSDLNFYSRTAQELALELAQVYHVGTQDPVGNLTIPEMLAVVELASHDLADMVQRYLPAGHLLTVNDWKQARRATEWYRTASNAYWAVSAIFTPYNTALRYLASQVGMAQPWQALQQNLQLWFYTAYLHRLGNYLIELYSGRLRVGAARYQALVRQLAAADGKTPTETAERPITLTIMGQVKMGKSSFINALLGAQRAKTDVVPATAGITRYLLQPVGITTPLLLLDTVGYAHTGPREDQLRATEEAARQSEVLLLVLHARNPGRQADVEMLQKLRSWFETQPALKMPPVLAVVTHIDLLSPTLEWQPPYNWQKPTRPKEKQIAEALAAVREQLGEQVAGVVPVCTSEGKVYGVAEYVMPAISRLLGEARTVAMLRCIQAEADTGKVRKVFEQLWSSGRELIKAVLTPPSEMTR